MVCAEVFEVYPSEGYAYLIHFSFGFKAGAYSGQTRTGVNLHCTLFGRFGIIVMWLRDVCSKSCARRIAKRTCTCTVVSMDVLARRMTRCC